jgi:hypothetical protein
MGLDHMRQSFLDPAAVSLAPAHARAGTEAFWDLAVRGEAGVASRPHLAMDNRREESLEQAGKLLNTQLENLALIESTTHDLYIAANVLPLILTTTLSLPIPNTCSCATPRAGTA